MMKSSWKSIGLGFILAVWILIGAPTGAADATIIQPGSTVRQSISDLQEIASVESVVDQYRVGVPADFYAIRTISALKSFLATHQTTLIDGRNPIDRRWG